MKSTLFFQDRIAIPLFLLVLSFLSFGILTPWLGFLQDDWYIMWHAHAFGPSVFVDFFSWERPGLAGIYWVTSSILGTSPIIWQIFAVFSRWVVTVAFWWMLILLWPPWKRQVTWIAVLFAVYPGFRSLHFSVIFANLLLILAIHIFSFCAMILAIQRPRWFVPFTILSVLFSAFSLFSAEYFFGWELLRPVFIWIALREKGRIKNRSKLFSVFLHWLPYLAVLLSFFIWRVFIFKFPTKYKPILLSETIANPPATMLKILTTIVQDIFDTSLFAWQRTMSLLKINEIQDLSQTLTLGLAIITGVLVAIWLFNQERKIDGVENNAPIEGNNTWAKSAIYIGLLSAVVAGWPFWSVGLEVNSDIGPDRFTLAFMMGVGLLSIGILEYLIRNPAHKIILISIFVGLAAGQHFGDANVLRRVHDAQGAFFHQLTWRAPDLKPGTILVTDKFPLSYSSDTSLTAPLNWIYNRRPPYSMQYAILELESRLGNVIPKLKPDVPILFGFRATKLPSSTSNLLVFNYSPPGCLRILDPALDLSATLPELVASAASLSNLDQIVVDPQESVQVPRELFGPQPEPDWCYFYEKADLARQKGEWNIVLELGETAAKKGLAPAMSVEYLPFIEANLKTHRMPEAQQMTIKAWRNEPILQPILCTTWEKNLQMQILSNEEREIADHIVAEVGCSKR